MTYSITKTTKLAPSSKPASLDWLIQHEVKDDLAEAYLPEKLIDFGEKDKIIALISPPGTGKTTLLKQLRIKAFDYTFVFISFRRSLVSAISNTFEVAHYKDLSHVDYESFNDSVAITFDSLKYLKPENYASQKIALILDEAQAGFRHLLQSETFTQSNPILGEVVREDSIATLNKFIKTADKIILSDADLKEDVVEYAQAIKEDSHASVFLNTYKKPREAHNYENFDEIIQAIVNDVADGKNTFVACSNRDTVITLAGAFKSYTSKFGTKKILDVHADSTQRENVQNFLKDPSRESLKYDVVIVSPTAFTGVDINPPGTPHFTNIYLLSQFTHLASDDLLQAIERVRNPSGHVHFYLEYPVATLSDDDFKNDPVSSLKLHFNEQSALQKLKGSLLARKREQVENLESSLQEGLQTRGYIVNSATVKSTKNVKKFLNDGERALKAYNSKKHEDLFKNFGLFTALDSLKDDEPDNVIDAYTALYNDEALCKILECLGKTDSERLTRAANWAISDLSDEQAFILFKEIQSYPLLARAVPRDIVRLVRGLKDAIPSHVLDGERFTGDDLVPLAEFLKDEHKTFRGLKPSVTYTASLATPLRSALIVLEKMFGLKFDGAGKSTGGTRRCKQLDMEAFGITKKLAEDRKKIWIRRWHKEMSVLNVR